ncbi:hypothetical protein ABR738_01195 [Streptomyces sp. Edi4]|uniref:hypothetical protein n=1 Tax=Streptomyces sp. Edi4 TaxID=3162527 RepID=UPI003305D403
MIELLVLIAIAYAGARGVENVAGSVDRRHHSKDADTAVAKVAASSRSGSAPPTPAKTDKPEKPRPAEPGGTFAAAAPRSAALGGKAAVLPAVIVESSTVMWKAVGEGYRKRWPEIREERRVKMAERAAKRTADKEAAAAKRKSDKDAAEAKKKAEEAAAKAGPPPPFPPRPAEPPKSAGPEVPATPGATEKKEPADKTGPPDASRPPQSEALREKERADKAEKELAEAKKEAEQVRDRAARDKVLAAQKEAREAKERAAAAEDRARAAEAKNTDPGRRHLSVVPSPAQNGDIMSSPSTVIPEIRTLDGLMNALVLTKAMCEMRAEEAEAVAADDLSLSNRLDQIEAEMAEMEVDAGTRAEIDLLRESIHTQSQAAAQYGGAAKDAADFAQQAAAAAYKSHGGIAEAVQSSPIELAAQAGYYER